jgi:2-octaprenylphenol hydroxylase
MALPDALFCKQLTLASEAVLGEIVAVGPRGLFPLRLGHAETYCRPGFVLVGDAAHAMHPLAGQGVNLGFMDAMTLVDVIKEAYAAGRAIGSISTLRRYERARKGPNMAMLAAMDSFKRIFSNDLLPLKLMRNLGLDVADRSGFVKHQLIRRAMGMSGELPSLAK